MINHVINKKFFVQIVKYKQVTSNGHQKTNPFIHIFNGGNKLEIY